MNIETFNKFYTPVMMDIITKLHDEEVSRLCEILRSGNNLVLNHHLNSSLPRLSQMKMLIECYSSIVAEKQQPDSTILIDRANDYVKKMRKDFSIEETKHAFDDFSAGWCACLSTNGKI